MTDSAFAARVNEAYQEVRAQELSGNPFALQFAKDRLKVLLDGATPKQYAKIGRLMAAGSAVRK